MGVIEPFTIKKVARDVFEFRRIVLSETTRSRTVFYATLNPDGVHGEIVYEKKNAQGEWVFEKDLDKTKIKQGQWMKVDLKTSEATNMMNYLQSLENFNRENNLDSFNHYIFVDSMIGLSKEEIGELNKAFANGASLLKNIAKLSKEGRIDLINKLSAGDKASSVDLELFLDNLNDGQVEEARAKINLVQLNQSIKTLRGLIQSDAKEKEFQEFFENNEYVLTIAIPSIIHVIDSQPYCGGKGINGSGGSYGDFLCRESNNTVFIEIKTPSCELVLGEPNRNGINKISGEIVNSVVQVKYQKDQFYKEWARDTLYKDSFLDANCYVIAGHTKQLDCQEKVNAFELFKKSLSNVTIITYDELLSSLERLKAIITE